MESKRIPIGQKYIRSLLSPRNGLLRKMFDRDPRPFSGKEGIPLEHSMIRPALNLKQTTVGLDITHDFTESLPIVVVDNES